MVLCGLYDSEFRQGSLDCSLEEAAVRQTLRRGRRGERAPDGARTRAQAGKQARHRPVRRTAKGKLELSGRKQLQLLQSQLLPPAPSPTILFCSSHDNFLSVPGKCQALTDTQALVQAVPRLGHSSLLSHTPLPFVPTLLQISA